MTRRTADPLLRSAAALLAAAAIFAGWSGWSWYRAAHSQVTALALTRDQVLQAGEQAVQDFSTLDYRTVSRGLNLWEQASTGALHREIVAGRSQFEQQIRQDRTITTAKILDGALTSLDVHAGTATIIVAIQLTVTPANGTPAVKQNRLTGQLTRTSSGWRLSSLGQVPVGAAAPAGGNSAGKP